MKDFVLKKPDYSNKHKIIIRILYIICLLGGISISLLIVLTRKAPEDYNDTVKYIDISNLWSLDEAGNIPADMKLLGKNMDENIGVISVYYQLPELIQDINLVYRSKDVYTSVFVDGEKIYETSVFESKWYNDSPGCLWNVLTINSKYSGKCIELQVKMVYDTKAITVDSLMLGDKADIILDLFNKNLFALAISMLMLIEGVVLIILDFLPAYGQARTKHSLLWLGLFTLLTGIWCIIETNMLQFCVKDMRKLQFIDNMIMIIDSVPLLIYMDCEHEMFKNRGMRLLTYVNIAYIFLCVFIQLTRLSDLHNMLPGAILLMLATDISMFIYVVVRLFKRLKVKEELLNSILQLLGICSLWGLAIFEALRTYNQDRIDRANLVRMGMLFLSFFWSMSSQIETYRLIVQGLKYDFVSKLAYMDALTGIGNRTAYKDKLEEYEQKAVSSHGSVVNKIGIIFFDVNFLKKVNDIQGHELGDKLIQTAADIITSSFGEFGDTYRIGGDEFCVIMNGKDLQDDYEKGLVTFKQNIEKKNSSGIYPFDIQIAHGFAICDELEREKIDYTIAIADSRMYENKIRIKTNMP